METLQKQVAIAHKRMLVQQLLRTLPWCWFGCFALAAVAIAASRFWPVPVDDVVWTSSWLGGAAAAGLLLAIGWTFWRSQTSFSAALEIDRRFGLRERVSSALALGTDERETPVGQALVADAIRRIDRLEVAERFGVSLDRRAWLPVIPAVIAFALAFGLDPKAPTQTAGAAASTAETQAAIKKSAEALQKKIAERRQTAKEKGLADAEGLFKKLEEGTKKLAEKDESQREHALVQLNDLAKDLQKRKQNLGGDEQFKQQLNQLKNMQQGPADKVAQSLKNGDLKQAQQELDKLKEQLKNDKLDEKQKEQLGQQLEQMKQAVDKAVQNHEQAKQALQEQIEQQKAAGNTGEADKLQQQLEKLQQQDQRMSQLGKMADKLGKAAEGMKNGDTQAAQDALDQLKGDLDSMRKEGEELQMLDDALDQISQAKDSMNCKQCQGEGCEHCQGKDPGQGQGQGKQNGPPGNDLGQGQGKGERPEEKTKTGFYDSKVSQNVRKGAAVATDFVEGKNRKGEVQEEIKAEFESAKREAADPLAGQRLPRDYREHAKKYFDSLREGKK